MSLNPKILIIMGSVRQNRICPDISRWVASAGLGVVPFELEIMDLRDWPLPMDAEPAIPAHGGYTNAATMAWSEKVGAAAGFVFVTPQYNWGYPAALKNAIDHLYVEWTKKPAMIVTYGGHGGGKCAGQLQQVLTGLKMQVVADMPALTLSRAVIEANTGEIDAAAAFAEQLSELQGAFRELALLL